MSSHPTALLSITLRAGQCTMSCMTREARFETVSGELEQKEFMGLPCMDSAQITGVIRDLFQRLVKSFEVCAITVACADGISLLCNSYGNPISPAIIGQPLTVPGRDVPDFFQSQGLGQIYRNSLIRRLRHLDPGFMLNESPGIITLGAFVYRYLTGICADVCLPVGIPSHITPDNRNIVWEALGFNRQNSSICLSAGESHPLRGELRRILSDEIPVFIQGTDASCAFYGTAADPLGWAGNIGWRMEAGWNAPASAGERMTFQILESGDKPGTELNQTQENEETVKESTLIEWSDKIRNVIGENICIFHGPRKNYELSCVRTPDMNSPGWKTLCGWRGQPWTENDLKEAPIGSGGLRILPLPDGYHFVGFQPGHTAAHIRRAFLEGLVFELRRYRIFCGTYRRNPIKLTISSPWSPNLANLICDIMGESIIFVPLEAGEAAAVGAPLALARDLNWLQPDARVQIDSIMVEPGERSSRYEAFYKIHEWLVEKYSA